MIDIKLTISEAAYKFAKGKHKGQMYGDMPYTVHLHHTAHLVEVMHKDHNMLDTLLAIAYLHDVMEDCGVTYEELVKEFGVCIATSVQAMTKVKGEIFPDYMEKVIANSMARKVKICDTMTNLHHSFIAGREKGMLKYPNQLAILHRGHL